MASYQQLNLNCSDQLPNSHSLHTRRGYSKAQTCFFKILHVISSIPPGQNSKLEDDGGLGPFPINNKGIGVDLNLSFCSVAESGESESFAENGSDTSAIEGNNNRGGDPEAETEAVQEKSVEVSEAMDAQVQSFKVFNNGVDDHGEEEPKEDRKGNQRGVETVPFGLKRNAGGDVNCLDLLIEAAKLVSAKDESNLEGLSGELRSGRGSEETGIVELEVEVEEGASKKRMQRWMVVDSYSDVEETPPVVRSKRGRNQVLPHRFRDSVVEPLKRLGRPQRPSSTKKRLIRS